MRWLGDFPDADSYVSVVEMHLEPSHQIRDERTPEGEWLILELGDEGFEVGHYMNLFAAGVIRYARGFGHPDDALRADAAAVYDVGQGNANALLESSGMPVLYYDLGGGVLGNRHTFPSPSATCTSTGIPGTPPPRRSAEAPTASSS